jgi:hypothetical protein
VNFDGFQAGPRTGFHCRTEGTAAGAGPVRAGSVGFGTPGEPPGEPCPVAPPWPWPPSVSSVEQPPRVRRLTAAAVSAAAETTRFFGLLGPIWIRYCPFSARTRRVSGPEPPRPGEIPLLVVSLALCVVTVTEARTCGCTDVVRRQTGRAAGGARGCGRRPPFPGPPRVLVPVRGIRSRMSAGPPRSP